MSRHRLAAFSLLALSLTGCDTIRDTFGFNTPTAMAQANIDTLGAACPATAVLADAATVTKAKPGAAPGNAAAVAFTAEMSQARLDCNYNRTSNQLSVDVTFEVRATRGPAATGPDPDLNFFVAVVDVDNNVITKQVFQNPPQMAGKVSNTYRQNVTGFVVPLGKDKHPPDYEILTGFQLSPEELAFNRTPRALPALKTKP